MQQNEDLWYRLGYAVESARSRLPELGRGVKSGLPALSDPDAHKLLEAFLAVGAGTLLARLFSAWPARSRPGTARLLRAGTAGAAAAFLAELLRPLLTGKALEGSLEEEIVDILLSGAGRGLLYAALVEPRVPGPPVLQGTAYGAIEYALTPWGGLEELAGKAAPQRRVPFLATLLRGRDQEEPFLGHLAFGIVLALLYEE